MEEPQKSECETRSLLSSSPDPKASPSAELSRVQSEKQALVAKISAVRKLGELGSRTAQPDWEKLFSKLDLASEIADLSTSATVMTRKLEDLETVEVQFGELGERCSGDELTPAKAICDEVESVLDEVALNTRMCCGICRCFKKPHQATQADKQLRALSTKLAPMLDQLKARVREALSEMDVALQALEVRLAAMEQSGEDGVQPHHSILNEHQVEVELGKETAAEEAPSPAPAPVAAASPETAAEEAPSPAPAPVAATSQETADEEAPVADPGTEGGTDSLPSPPVKPPTEHEGEPTSDGFALV
jgi:hypothetical protein